MPKPEPVGSGTELRLYREGLLSKLLTSDKLQTAYVLERPNDQQPDRRWNFRLYRGDTYGTGAPYLLRLVRLQPEQLIQLVTPGGESVADVVRFERDRGYVASDPRHVFTWKNRHYMLAAHRGLGGKDHSCVDRSTGETVAFFKNKVFHRKQEGQLVISSKMQGEDMDVMVAAYLAFREFDERRDMLMFGDPWFNQDVTG